MKQAMNDRVRDAIIRFLVAQEQPETPEIAQALTEEWYDVADEELIKANNYNQIRRFQQMAERKRS